MSGLWTPAPAPRRFTVIGYNQYVGDEVWMEYVEAYDRKGAFDAALRIGKAALRANGHVLKHVDDNELYGAFVFDGWLEEAK